MALSSLSTSLAALDLQTTILAIISLAILFFLVSTAAQWYRLRHIPGPPLASLTSLWACLAVCRLQFHHVVQATQQKHGKLVRIAPNALLVSDPEAVWRINSARSIYTRGGFYASNRFNPYGDSVFSEMDTVRHDKRKAKLVYGFSGKGLMDLEGNLDTQLGLLVEVLRKRTQAPGQTQNTSRAVVDLGRMLQQFQVDLITFAGLGEAWGDLPDDEDHHGYLALGNVQLPFVHAISMVPLARYIFFSPIFLRWFGPNTSDGYLGVLQSAVKQRVSGDQTKESGGNMLDEWLKHGLTPAEAELDLSLQMPAGTETSISTIRAIMLYLMATPCVYQKLKQEIALGIQEGRISSPVTNDEAKNLPYLQAVINEGMRIAPPLSAGFAKRVPQGGDVICGKAVPEGTEVHVNIISMMRDPEVFGSDADLFRPERFIECDEATKARRLKVVDLNFGHGRWLCLGKVLAWMEMNKIFVELFRNFDFQVVNPEKPWRRQSTVSFYIHDLYAQVTDNPIG